MINLSEIIIGLIDVLTILLPVLLSVAFMTLIERKALASMQRRVGPQIVGFYGILNPLKKLSKKLLFLVWSHLCKLLECLIIYSIPFFIFFLVYLTLLIILSFCWLLVLLVSLKSQCPEDLYFFPFVISNDSVKNSIFPTIELLSSIIMLSNGKPIIVWARSGHNPLYSPYFPFSTTKSNKTVETNSACANDKKVEILNKAINKLKQIAKSKGLKLKPLNTPALYTIHNVLDVAERNKLYAKLRNTEELLGGIYAIQYKYNPNIFYIGRAFVFSSRLASHINNSLRDERLFTSNLFYNFVRAAGGWENFTFHIIEFLPKNRELQTERENFYFIKFNPILNTMTSPLPRLTQVLGGGGSGQCDSKKSLIKKELSMSDSKHNNSLELKNKHSRKPKLIWIYKIDSNLLNQSLHSKPELLFKFMATSLGLRKSSELTGVDRNIMSKFIDSNRILNGYLFYTSPITNFKLTLQLVKKTWDIYGSGNSSIKVWCYHLENPGLFNLVTPAPFESIREYGKFLGVHDVLANRFVDLFKPDSKKGLYAFSKPITPEIIKTILSNPLKLKPRTQSVYVYDFNTLELINNKPFNSIKECYLTYKISRQIVIYYIDTEKATLLNEKYCYLFRSAISNNLKKKLLAKSVLLNDLKSAPTPK